MESNLAFSSTEFNEGELSLFLETAQRFGVRNLELWHPKHVNSTNVAEVKEQLERSGMRCICVSTWSQLNADSRSVDRVLSGIDLARALGAGLTNTYFGPNSSRSSEEAVAAYVETITPAVRLAAEAGVTIVLENEFDVEGKDPECSDVTRRAEGSRAIWEAVNSPHFALTFDPGNYCCAGEEAYPLAYRTCKEAIGYIHLKDVRPYDPGKRPAGSRDKQVTEPPLKVFRDPTGKYVCVPLGEGVIDWGGLLQELKADAYDGYLTLEPHTSRELLNDSYERSLRFLADSGFAV